MSGGGKKSVLDAVGFNVLGGALGGLAAIAGTSSDVQGATQNAIDSAGLNPATTKTKIENEAKLANSEQASKEAALKENEQQNEYAKKNAAKRNRQRSLMGQSGGRSGTILTSGLGESTAAPGKTLLGS